jgi:FlaA1/EpsC-like NDP-sugar epimerase
MARNLIRLSGFLPDEEIPIVFTGLRPGEKLSEELVAANETSGPSPVPHINRVRQPLLPDFNVIAAQISQLERLAAKGRTRSVIAALCEIVPTFTPEADRPIERLTEATATRQRPPISEPAIGTRRAAVLPSR